MTPEAQRIAIAEACGWKNIRRGCNAQAQEPIADSKVAGLWCPVTIPDYLNDLNAMHEAVKCLDQAKQQHVAYAYRLEEIVSYDEIGQVGHILALSEATPQQRSKAFLLAIGKWV